MSVATNWSTPSHASQLDLDQAYWDGKQAKKNGKTYKDNPHLLFILGTPGFLPHKGWSERSQQMCTAWVRGFDGRANIGENWEGL